MKDIFRRNSPSSKEVMKILIIFQTKKKKYTKPSIFEGFNL